MATNGVLPASSAGDTVSAGSTARDDNANSVLPPKAQQILTPTGRITPAGQGSGTNAVRLPTLATDSDVGTNAPTRTTVETQAITERNNTQGIAVQLTDGSYSNLKRNPETGELYDPGTNSAPIGGPGVAAPNDDQRIATAPRGSNTVRNRVDELYGGASNGIVSQDNILDQYASYTYSLSWYLMTPDAYNAALKSDKKDLNGYYLLAQSGGASTAQGSVTSNGTTTTTTSAGRSPYFNLDYYLDNLVLEQVLSSNPQSKGAAKTATLSFTVTEPNGITLISNLFEACNDLFKTTGKINTNTVANYASATFCMVIRFYGYDENGNMVYPIAKKTGSTDRKAAVEKFVFFIITEIKLNVGNRIIEYKVTGASPDTVTALSSNRGSIPNQFNFSGATVSDILIGQVQQQTASNAAGDKTRNNVPVKPTPPAVDQAAAAAAAGTDPNAVNPQGMAFGGGGL
jgi:hypothetical protein